MQIFWRLGRSWWLLANWLELFECQELGKKTDGSSEKLLVKKAKAKANAKPTKS